MNSGLGSPVQTPNPSLRRRMALRPASVGKPLQGRARRRGLVVAVAPQVQHQVNSPLSDWLTLWEGCTMVLPTLSGTELGALGGAGKHLLLTGGLG